MKRYKVIITDKAFNDMKELYLYISFSLHSPDTAMRQYNRIDNAILSLDYFPERFELTEFSSERLLAVRRMPVDNYIVCYYVDGDTVYVIAVIYYASNVENIISKRIQ